MGDDMEATNIRQRTFFHDLDFVGGKFLADFLSVERSTSASKQNQADFAARPDCVANCLSRLLNHWRSRCEVRLERNFVASNMKVITSREVPIEYSHDLAFSYAEIAMCLYDRFRYVTQVGRDPAIYSLDWLRLPVKPSQTNQSTVL